MCSVNAKETRMFECGRNRDDKYILIPHEFRVFREQISFLAEVSKS